MLSKCELKVKFDVSILSHVSKCACMLMFYLIVSLHSVTNIVTFLQVAQKRTIMVLILLFLGRIAVLRT